MKIGKYDYTLKNIKNYLIGNLRMLIDKFGPEFLALDTHIQEQIIFREKVANDTCKASGYCKCNCSVPGLFYADKTCHDECYPEMLNENDWRAFKEKINQLELSSEHPLFKFWINTNDMIKLEFDSDLGIVDYDSIIFKSIKVSSKEPYDIEEITTSCGCTNVIYNKPFDSTNNQIDVEINTSMKRPDAPISIGISIKWSNNQTSYIEFYGYNKSNGHSKNNEAEK